MEYPAPQAPSYFPQYHASYYPPQDPTTQFPPLSPNEEGRDNMERFIGNNYGFPAHRK